MVDTSEEDIVDAWPLKQTPIRGKAPLRLTTDSFTLTILNSWSSLISSSTRKIFVYLTIFLTDTSDFGSPHVYSLRLSIVACCCGI